MLDRLIGTLDVDQSSYPSHYISCSRSENDAPAPEFEEYDDALPPSSESDIDSDTDYDDDYDYFKDHRALSVRNPDPQGDNTCLSDIELEPPIARFEEASTSSERLESMGPQEKIGFSNPAVSCRFTGLPEQII
jgi:hypothetical protein